MYLYLVFALFQRKYLRFDAQDTVKNLSVVTDLLNKKWMVTRPSFVMTVTGGDMSSLDALTRESLSDALRKLAKNTSK